MKGHPPHSKMSKWTPRFYQTDRKLIAGELSPFFDAIFRSPRRRIYLRLDTSFSPMKGVSINFTVKPRLKTETARKYLNALGFNKSFIDSYIGALSGSASTPEAMRISLEAKGYKKDRVDLILRQLASLGTIREDRNRSDAEELNKLGERKGRISRTQWELWFSLLKKISGEKLKGMLTADLKSRVVWEERLNQAKKDWNDVYLTENAIAEITSELSGKLDAGDVRTKLVRYRGKRISLAHQALLNRLDIPDEAHNEILAIVMGQ